MAHKKIELTTDIRERLRAVQEALAVHVPGRDSSASVDVPKLELADAVLQQLGKLRPAKAALAVKRRKRA